MLISVNLVRLLDFYFSCKDIANRCLLHNHKEASVLNSSDTKQERICKEVDLLLALSGDVLGMASS